MIIFMHHGYSFFNKIYNGVINYPRLNFYVLQTCISSPPKTL